MTDKTTAADRKAAVDSDFAPFYALAGFTDAAAEKMTSAVRARITERQQQLGERLSAFRGQPAEVRKQAKESADELATFLRDLPQHVRDLPATAQTQIAALQRKVEEYRAEAETAYGDYAGRGRTVVEDAIKNARGAGDRAAEAADPAFEKVQETVTNLRQSATGHATTETTTTKSAAKASATKAATKKAPAAKKTTTAKKAPAKKA